MIRTGERYNRWVPWLVGFAASLFGAAGQAQAPRIFAITDVRIVTAPGEVIERGTLVMRDGLIEGVGANTEVPTDATVFAGEPEWTVYPALIDAAAAVGLNTEESPEGSRRRPETPTLGAPHELPTVQADMSVVDQLDFSHGSLKRHRELGFAVAHVLPASGVFRGESAVILLRDAPAQELVLIPRMAQVVALEKSSFMARQYPSSSIGAVAAVRQTLLDAERQLTWNERFAIDPVGMPNPPYRASDAALAAVLREERPVVFVSLAELDPGRFQAISDEFSLRALTVATGLGQRPDGLAGTTTPLLLPLELPEEPELDDPEAAREISLRDMQAYLRAPALPGKLAQSDVEFAFVTAGMKSARDFPANLAAVVEAGLPPDQALAAVTTVPARLLGLDRVIGTLAAGKQANVLVVEGELFTAEPELRHAFIAGYHYEFEPDEVIGDPNAVVDPRGTWDILTEVMGKSSGSTWTISGSPDDYEGFSQSAAGDKQDFKRVRLRGNALTVISDTTRGEFERTVVITGDSLEGDTTMESPRGSVKMAIEGRRVAGPEARR